MFEEGFPAIFKSCEISKVIHAPIGADIENRSKWNKMTELFNFWFNKIDVKEKEAGSLCKNIAIMMTNAFESWGFESSDNKEVVRMMPSVRQ